MAIRKLLGRGELQLYGHSTYFLGLLKESVSMNVVKRSEYCNGGSVKGFVSLAVFPVELCFELVLAVK